MRVSIHISPDEADALLVLATRERRDPQAQAAALVAAGLDAAGLGSSDPPPRDRGLAWDDDKRVHTEGARLALSLPSGVAAQLADAATRERRTLRQQAVHLLAAALSPDDAL